MRFTDNLTTLVLILATSTVVGLEVSEHNEQQAALSSAYALLYTAGCVRPEHTRTERYKLIQDKDRYHIKGNTLTVTCKKRDDVPVTVVAYMSWDLPTRRENGVNLNADEIANFIIYHNGVGTKVAGNMTTHHVAGLETGDHVFTMQTIDTMGNISSHSEPYEITVN